ncbi:hypothetical protein MMC15_005076 [Xylographa vitiligo]|nr:hypothetical protein [Xylographa vitiligo]
MPPDAIAGSSSSVANTSPEKSYRPPSSVYEIVRPLSTKFQSELDAVHTKIRTIPPRKGIGEDHVASPCSERLAGEYRAELLSPSPIDPDRHTQYLRIENSLSSTKPERIYGLTPAIFWIVILMIVSLVAAGVAIGLALGLSRVEAAGNARYGDNSTSRTIYRSSLLDSRRGVLIPMLLVVVPPALHSTTLVNADGDPSPETELTLPNTASPTPPYTDTIDGTVSNTSSAAWHSNTNPGTVKNVIFTAPMPNIVCPNDNNATTTFPFYVNGTSLTYQGHCKTNYAIDAFPTFKDIQVVPNVRSLASCIEFYSYYTVQVPHGGPRNYSTGYSAFCTGMYYWQNACYLKSGVVPGVLGASANDDGAILVKNDLWSE